MRRRPLRQVRLPQSRVLHVWCRGMRMYDGGIVRLMLSDYPCLKDSFAVRPRFGRLLAGSSFLPISPRFGVERRFVLVGMMRGPILMRALYDDCG